MWLLRHRSQLPFFCTYWHICIDSITPQRPARLHLLNPALNPVPCHAYPSPFGLLAPNPCLSTLTPPLSGMQLKIVQVMAFAPRPLNESYTRVSSRHPREDGCVVLWIPRRYVQRPLVPNTQPYDRTSPELVHLAVHFAT